MKLKFIASISVSLLLVACTKKTAEEKKQNLDTIKTYYDNGKLEFVKILKDSVEIDHKFFDRRGVLLNHTYKPGHSIFYTYYKDTAIYEREYFKFWKDRSTGPTGMKDSGFVYFNSPNELAIKHYKKDKKYIITYYKNSKAVNKDTISERKLLDAAIHSYLGADTLIGGYVPDVDEK